MNFTIKGTGQALPAKKISNDDLSKMMDTSDEWIVSKTGIKERRVLTSETLTELAIKAAADALEDAKVNATQVDMVIVASICGDTYTPSMACCIAEALKINKPAFDINAACTGFIYALDVAAGFFARGRAKTVLIVCAEQMSRHIDWNDRSTAVLFGDGASAVVLTEGDSLISIKLSCQPNSEFIHIGFDGDSPFNSRERDKSCLRMNGQEVYKFAISAAATDLSYVLNESGLNESDISFLLLHQANMRIINAIKDKLKLPPEKLINCIERTGNMSSVALPFLLDEGSKSGKFKNGDIIALSSFGGGLTSAAALLRWNK